MDKLKNIKCEYCLKLNENIKPLKTTNIFNSKYAFRCLDCGLINDNNKTK